jgi:hypothetical protein
MHTYYSGFSRIGKIEGIPPRAVLVRCPQVDVHKAHARSALRHLHSIMAPDDVRDYAAQSLDAFVMEQGSGFCSTP